MIEKDSVIICETMKWVFGTIKTNWYHKPTWSGRFLNFNSNHPYKCKINVINNLVDRCISLSHKDFHKANFKKIKSILHKNNYPPNMINSCIEKRLYHLSLETLSTNTKSHQPLRIIPTHTQTT